MSDSIHYCAKCKTSTMCHMERKCLRQAHGSTASPCSLTGTERRVCEDVAKRQQIGIVKYQTTVEENPLPLVDWLQHAYEETLDKAIYLKRAIEEIQENAKAMPRPENGNESSENNTMSETTDTTEDAQGVGHQPLVSLWVEMPNKNWARGSHFEGGKPMGFGGSAQKQPSGKWRYEAFKHPNKLGSGYVSSLEQAKAEVEILHEANSQADTQAQRSRV